MPNVLYVGDKLIITDNKENEKLFSELGFSSLAVANSDAHAMAMLRRGIFDLILLDSKYDSLLCKMADDGISVPTIIFTEGCDASKARFYIRHGVLDLLPKPSEPEELFKSLCELSPRLQSVRRIPLQEIEALTTQAYDAIKNSEESETEVHRVFQAIAAQYGEHDGYRDILIALCKQIERRFLSEFPWVLLFHPIYAPDLSAVPDPGAVAEDFFCSYAAKIRAFRLERLNSVANSVCRYLTENMTDNPSQDTVARVYGISKSSLSSLFSRRVGISFQDYRRLLKMEYAKHMLLNSTYRIHEISRLLGYQSTDYFTEQFRFNEGCTPSEFRRRNGIVSVNSPNSTKTKS